MEKSHLTTRGRNLCSKDIYNSRLDHTTHPRRRTYFVSGRLLENIIANSSSVTAASMSVAAPSAAAPPTSPATLPVERVILHVGSIRKTHLNNWPLANGCWDGRGTEQLRLQRANSRLEVLDLGAVKAACRRKGTRHWISSPYFTTFTSPSLCPVQ